MAELLFDKENIVLCFFWKFVEFFDSTDVTVPAFKGLKYRLCLFKLRSRWEVFCDFAVDFVCRANLDFFKIPEALASCPSPLRCALTFDSVA